MEIIINGRLHGYENHGFRTIQDLDVLNVIEEAKTRWLRPNEIYAVLLNYGYFSICVKPLNFPRSGTLVLFDRKKLRNFRKDGHSWRKKKDGKTVKEAHEHLKVGDDERIHVYYAHGDDCPTFVRRCFWLLEKKLEHIVLVHYRETQEGLVSSANSTSWNQPRKWMFLNEDITEASCAHIRDHGYYKEYNSEVVVKNHETTLFELNTLDWGELIATDMSGESASPECDTLSNHYNRNAIDEPLFYGSSASVNSFYKELPSSANLIVSTVRNHGMQNFHIQAALPEHLFIIRDVVPSSAYSTEITKIVVVGFHREEGGIRKLLCVCGESCVPVEFIQVGAYSCSVPPQPPGKVRLFLSFDGVNPVSEIRSFEYRIPPLANHDELQAQIRLSQLLFSPSSSARRIPNCEEEVARFTAGSIDARDGLLELQMRCKLQEWLPDDEGRHEIRRWDYGGQGTIHLCAVLGYAWAVPLFSRSGISLDSRDRYGRTALHWASYYGREKMVTALISAGAKMMLVTDPTKEHPDGLVAADLASMNGHDGLAAYLSEKSLVEHLTHLSLAGNATSSLPSTADGTRENELVRDSLAACRTASDVAARIRVALLDHSERVHASAAQMTEEMEERTVTHAALLIQRAYHSHVAWKRTAVPSRLRRQALKIQAAFRGFRVRRKYQKIVWAVGVLEKAILRWRFKRRGLRGLVLNPPIEGGNSEEDFFRDSRIMAENRIGRAVIQVHGLFRSKLAQQAYQRIKLSHIQHAKEDGM